MSTLSQFFGGGIKSIQRGVTNASTGSGGTTTATITAVDTAKSVVIATARNGYDATGPTSASPAISLTSSTQLTITQGAANGTISGPGAVHWQVVEFN